MKSWDFHFKLKFRVLALVQQCVPINKIKKASQYEHHVQTRTNYRMTQTVLSIVGNGTKN